MLLFWEIWVGLEREEILLLQITCTVDTAKSNADLEYQILKHLLLNVFLNHEKSWLVLLKIRWKLKINIP